MQSSVLALGRGSVLACRHLKWWKLTIALDVLDYCRRGLQGAPRDQHTAMRHKVRWGCGWGQELMGSLLITRQDRRFWPQLGPRIPPFLLPSPTPISLPSSAVMSTCRSSSLTPASAPSHVVCSSPDVDAGAPSAHPQSCLTPGPVSLCSSAFMGPCWSSSFTPASAPSRVVCSSPDMTAGAPSASGGGAEEAAVAVLAHSEGLARARTGRHLAEGTNALTAREYTP